MKEHILTDILLALLLIAVMSTTSYAERKLSDPLNPHNMSSSATHLGPHSETTDQICIFCHTPHSAAPDSPLWARPDPSMMGSFPLYNSPTLRLDNDPGRTDYVANGSYPSGSSRMCLSCHDGQTAIGILLGGDSISMPAGSEFIDGVGKVIDLAKAHPISFNYNQDVIDNVLDASYSLPTNPLINISLDAAGQMQCTTCHDPHADTRDDSNGESLPFWRHFPTPVGALLYDDVCQSCHTGTPGIGPHL